MIGHEDKGYCKATFSNSNNSFESLNILQLAEFIEDHNSREIVRSSIKDTDKGDTNEGFISVGKSKELGIYYSFYRVCKKSIYRSGKGS